MILLVCATAGCFHVTQRDPYLPLWFNDVVSVHGRALGALDLSPSGDYNFLTTLQPSGD